MDISFFRARPVLLISDPQAQTTGAERRPQPTPRNTSANARAPAANTATRSALSTASKSNRFAAPADARLDYTIRAGKDARAADPSGHPTRPAFPGPVAPGSGGLWRPSFAYRLSVLNERNLIKTRRLLIFPGLPRPGIVVS
jgi:hypothetical protein